MSVIGLILAFVSFLISPYGMLSLLIGFAGFFILPTISKTTSITAPSKFYLWLAKQPVKRMAVVVSEQNDIYFRTMNYESIGFGAIVLDGVAKLFEDPDNALSYWLNTRFAITDEKHGVIFDTRHAALGMRKHELRENDEGEYLATDDEWEEYGIEKWMPGVFEMPRKHELVNLSRVRELVDGGERSEFPERVKELYKHSRDPYTDGPSVAKFFYPIVAFMLTFGGIWILASQIGVPSSGPTDSVGWNSIGLGFLLLSVRSVDWKWLLTVIGLVVGTIAPFAAVALFINPVIAGIAFVTVLMGFLCVPALSLLGFVSNGIGVKFSWLFFRMAFMAYHTPIFEWTPKGYQIREYDELDVGNEGSWYYLFGKQTGFTFPPSSDSWGPESIENSEVESYQEALTDDRNEDSRLPKKYVRTNSLQRDSYGAYVPKRVKKSKYYLHSGIALNRFTNSATGEKALRKLLEAKEEFGEGNDGMPDKTVLYLSSGMGVLGIVLGVFFFIL